MKKSIIFPLLCGLCFCFFSCKYSTEYQTINVNNKFAVSVPPWMKQVDDLKPGAEFQYANRFRNFYMIGTSEDKDNLNTGASEVMNNNLNILRKALKNPVLSDSTEVTIGGLRGIKAEIFGKMKEEDIYFSELLLEGKTQYYHLSVWTRGSDRKLKYKEDIDRILNSFKPL